MFTRYPNNSFVFNIFEPIHIKLFHIRSPQFHGKSGKYISIFDEKTKLSLYFLANVSILPLLFFFVVTLFH